MAFDRETLWERRKGSWKILLGAIVLGQLEIIIAELCE